MQWAAQLGNGGYTNTNPVAVNSVYVFVSNVTTVYSFHRYTGVVEFVMDMGTQPSTGFAADDLYLYCVLGVQTGYSGAHRVAVYNLPRPIQIQETAKALQVDPNGKPIRDPKSVNPVDNLMGRYPPETMTRANSDSFDNIGRRSRTTEAPVAGFSGSRTPSLAALPRVTPPYTLETDLNSDSINLLPSFRQPYRLRTDFQKDIQQVASIGTIPPSVAAALALSDLRPKGIQPKLHWEYGFSSRVIFPVSLTPLRVWAITDARELISLSKLDKKLEASQVLDDPVAASPARAGVLMYLPLGSGYLLSIDAASGVLGGGANVLWRSTVGGICNRTPFVTDAMVYAQGDDSGVVCVDRKSGDVLWRTEASADRVLAANRDFLYVRNRLGKLLVYDAKRATDPEGKRSLPLAGIDLSEFNIPITNTVSDRLFLAADNGLIVCLRDNSAKYARPVRICPEATVNAQPKGSVEAQGNKEIPTPGEPKKEQDKKEPDKKEPDKKEPDKKEPDKKDPQKN